jgi:ribosomal protein S18 acetylase RimI-like enzyme
MVRRGELRPEGILVALRNAEMVGALVCLKVPGASALVWPPQTGPNDRTGIEDALVQYATSWLRGEGVRVAQCLLALDQRPLGESLLRNGFHRVTSLYYMRHDLGRLASPSESGLHFQTYLECDKVLFRDTLQQSYEGTLDCPELNGIRTMDEVLAGHLAQGRHDPRRWWLAFRERQPVGVLLLTEIPEWKAWDLSYLGVLAPHRCQAIGRQLTVKALWETRQDRQSKLTLSVDHRNHPAQRLYEKLGCYSYDSRDVYLAIWPRE